MPRFFRILDKFFRGSKCLQNNKFGAIFSSEGNRPIKENLNLLDLWYLLTKGNMSGQLKSKYQEASK